MKALTQEQAIELARDEYQDDDIQIDDNAALSQSEDGVWVAAWVWVENEGQTDGQPPPNPLPEGQS